MVPTYKRTQSKMEFISTAEDLVFCSKNYGEKIGKRHHWLGVRQVFDSAVNTLNEITLANNFNPKKDYEERTYHFKLALGYLNCVSTGITILKKSIRKDKNCLTDGQWEHWGILIATERKLIKGVMEYDKKLKV